MKNPLAFASACALLLFAARPALAQYDSNFDDGFGYAAAEPQGPQGPEEGPGQAAGPPPGQADFQTFHDALAPYGSWISTADYGWVWTPGGMPQGWRPYTMGQWEWTAYGWTWVGQEPWAWGPYHYGRWISLEGLGWSWIPGYEWGPAWVSWRYGPSYVGWTPLYPGYPYGGVWLDSYPVNYNQWAFVGYGGFYGGGLIYNSLYSPGYVQTNVWGVTHPVGAVVDNGATYCGPSRGYVSQASGHAVTPVPIHPVSSVSQAGVAGAAGSKSVNVYAPPFHSAPSPFAGGGQTPSVVSPDQHRGVGQLIPPGLANRGGAQGGALGAAHGGLNSGIQPYHGPLPGTPGWGAPGHGSVGGVSNPGGSYHAPSGGFANPGGSYHAPSGGFANGGGSYNAPSGGFSNGGGPHRDPGAGFQGGGGFRQPAGGYGSVGSSSGSGWRPPYPKSRAPDVGRVDQRALGGWPVSGYHSPAAQSGGFGGGHQASNYHQPSYGGFHNSAPGGGYHPSSFGGYHPSGGGYRAPSFNNNGGGARPAFGGGGGFHSTYHPTGGGGFHGGGFHGGGHSYRR